MVLTVHQLQLLQAIATVEAVDAIRVETGYEAVAITVNARVIYLLHDGAIIEYPDRDAVPWPVPQASRDRLRALYPTLAARQEAL